MNGVKLNCALLNGISYYFMLCHDLEEQVLLWWCEIAAVSDIDTVRISLRPLVNIWSVSV